MNLQDLRKNLKNPHQEIIFKQLFSDYKKFQIKKIRFNKLKSEDKDYTKSQKTLSAIKLDHILRKQGQIQNTLETQSPKKYIPNSQIRIRTKKSLQKTYSYFFKNQGRDKKIEKNCFFKDHLSTQNTLIPDSLKTTYLSNKQKILPSMLNNKQNARQQFLNQKRINKQNYLNWKSKYCQNLVNSGSRKEIRMQKAEQLLKTRFSTLQSKQNIFPGSVKSSYLSKNIIINRRQPQNHIFSIQTGSQ